MRLYLCSLSMICISRHIILFQFSMTTDDIEMCLAMLLFHVLQIYIYVIMLNCKKVALTPYSFIHGRTCTCDIQKINKTEQNNDVSNPICK